MARGTGIPVCGTDAVGAAGYVVIVAAPTAPAMYRNLHAMCSTQNAIISLDGGVTDHFHLTAGVPLDIGDTLEIQGAVHAKNENGGNYTALSVSVW